jgi:RNA polymerase sigma factor (TIGR02999 family)
MPEPSSQLVSELLDKWQAGDEESLRRLLPLVYKELRRLAHYYLRKERPDHTLQSTALVHEAYLRMMKQQPMQFKNRAHFFAVSAHLMREILVDYARQRKAAKRYDGPKLSLEEGAVLAKMRGADLIALDDALNALAQIDPQQSRIVELRFFAGLSIEETAKVLGISPATVKREWATARIWLHREMSGGLTAPISTVQHDE